MVLSSNLVRTLPFQGGNMGSNPVKTTIPRSGAVVARQPHKLKAGGSNPLSVTNEPENCI